MAKSHETPKHTPADEARVSKMRDGRVRVVCSCGYRSIPLLSGREAEALKAAHERG